VAFDITTAMEFGGITSIFGTTAIISSTLCHVTTENAKKKLLFIIFD
jgi:hypothetical protein